MISRLTVGLILAVGMYGQIEQANITGTVTDASGASVPGAAIAATNTQTRVRAETESNESGAYRLPYLRVGEYELTVEKQGFEKARVTGIQLTVGLTVTVNVEMKTGSLTQEVTVSAASVQLEQQTSSLGNTVNAKQIVELPLLGRNPYTLLLLTPGVMPTGGAGAGPIINGGRSNTSEILLDGAETRNSTTNDIAYTPPLETVEEFKVFTNGFSSEFGRSGGGVLTVATRSGTNRPHGAVYEFLRNDKLNANSWTSNRVGLKRNAFRRNEYGVSLGGPIYLPKVFDGRNRSFFFFNWEQIPQRSPDNLLQTVPTATERRSDFSRTVTNRDELIRVFDPAATRPSAAGQFIRDAFPGNVIPASRFDRISLRIMEFYPVPNRDTLVQNYVQNNSRQNDTDRLFMRFDHSIGTAHRLFLTVGMQDNSQFSPGINAAFPGEGVNGEQGRIGSDSIYSVLSHTATFRPNLIGQFRGSTTRRVIKTELRSAGFDFTQLGFPQSLKSRAKTLLFPRIAAADVAALGPDRASFFTDAEENREVQGHMTLVQGGHSVKFGGNFAFQTFNIFRPERPSGFYEFARTFTQGPIPRPLPPPPATAWRRFCSGFPPEGRSPMTRPWRLRSDTTHGICRTTGESSATSPST